MMQKAIFNDNIFDIFNQMVSDLDSKNLHLIT